MILCTSQIVPLGMPLKLVPHLLVYACWGVNGMFVHIWLTTDKQCEQREPLWMKTICYLSGTFISRVCWSSVVLPQGSETAVGCLKAGPVLWSLCLAHELLPYVFQQHLKDPNRISISLHLIQIKRHSLSWITKERKQPPLPPLSFANLPALCPPLSSGKQSNVWAFQSLPVLDEFIGPSPRVPAPLLYILLLLLCQWKTTTQALHDWKTASLPWPTEQEAHFHQGCSGQWHRSDNRPSSSSSSFFFF